MLSEISASLNDPQQLEKMYRADKAAFKKIFNAQYAALSGNPVADCWYERLNYEQDTGSRSSKKELFIIITLAVLAGCISKLPAWLGIDEDFFYPRNVGFILFPFLSAYFAWRNQLKKGTLLLMLGATLAGLIFINLLPHSGTGSDTLDLSCIHLILFLWALLGWAFVGQLKNDAAHRLGFLKYNGDLVVMTTLILIAGALLSAATIGLFSLIGLNIESFYFENIVRFALPAAPIMASYLTQVNPSLVGKVSPVIARIFSPLVLVMLVIYLGAMVYSGKDPYTDREFLLLFNLLLIGVMAIIFFSIAGATPTRNNAWEIGVLFLLSIVTILVNGVALSAILFRISQWGITPNRAAVLGSNLLILGHLLLVTTRLFKLLFKKASLQDIGKSISWYLPFYWIWAILVTFAFPILFGFK